MAKISIQDMAQAIAARHGLSQHDAEVFVSALFDVANAGLHEEKIVKVKGLGTFKVIGVRERESVNVNTGERVVIESHGKITFTPDTVMRDLVNKPFAQFETVVLNDGVDLDEMGRVQSSDDDDADDDSESGDVLAKDEAIPEENIEQAGPDAGNDEFVEDVHDDAETSEEEAVVETPPYVPVDDDIVQQDETPDIEPEPLEDKPVEDTDEGSVEGAENYGNEDAGYDNGEENGSFVSRHRGLFITLITVLVGAAAFTGGFYWGRTSVEPVVKTKTVYVVNKKHDVAAASADTLQRKDTIGTSKQDGLHTDTLKKAVKPDVKKGVATASQQYTAGSSELRNATAMVNTGAYRIVGTETTVTVKPGETLKGISKFYLGAGMECYIQVHNGIVDVKEGMKLKIPKLKLKKK